MNKNTAGGEMMNAIAAAAAMIGMTAAQPEQAVARGVYTATIEGYKEEHKDEYLSLFAKVEAMKAKYKASWKAKFGLSKPLRDAIIATETYMKTLTEVKHTEVFANVVCTAGKNYLLDNALAGSGYTAAFYLGLISSTSYTAVAAGDTSASHGGWLEAGATNAPAYSGSRKTAAWSAASAGSKALSAGLVFTFSSSGTIKGAFLSTVATVDATTGTLISAGLFTGGDQPVVATNTLTVTYSLGL